MELYLTYFTCTLFLLMTQLADNELTVQGIRYLNQRTYHRQAYIAVDVITIARLYQKVTKFKWFT